MSHWHNFTTHHAHQWRPFWISDRNDIANFYLQVKQWYFLPSFKSIGHLVLGEKAHHGSHLGFPIEKILVIFDLQVASILPIKFPVNRLQGAKGKIDIQNGWHSGHLGFPIRTILAIFYLQGTPIPPTKFWVNWPFGSGEEGQNRLSRWPQWPS